MLLSRTFFKKNANLPTLFVVLFAASGTAVLHVWDVPFNPARGIATVISMSAAVPPTVENGGLTSRDSTTTGSATNSSSPQALFIPGVVVDTTTPETNTEVASEDIVEQDEVSTTTSGTFATVRSDVQAFFSKFAETNTVPTSEQLEAFLAEELELLRNLTPEEVQEFSELIEKEVEIAQKDVENDVLISLQRALITFATLLLIGMGMILMV